MNNKFVFCEDKTVAFLLRANRQHSQGRKLQVCLAFVQVSYSFHYNAQLPNSPKVLNRR